MHSSLLQSSSCLSEPVHLSPPLESSMCLDLLRNLVPPPHVFVQEDHSPYSFHTQSTKMKIFSKLETYIHKHVIIE